MLVASNTSPVSNLAIIGRLHLLQTQFSDIWIPNRVHTELLQLSRPEALHQIHSALREGWIKRRAVREHRIVRLLTATLDPGEAEAIALAIEMSAELILLDEKDGRETAHRAGLRVTGVLGILLRAKTHGHIPAIRNEIDALRIKAHFFISRRLEDEVLKSAGE